VREELFWDVFNPLARVVAWRSRDTNIDESGKQASKPWLDVLMRQICALDCTESFHTSPEISAEIYVFAYCKLLGGSG
jgi:hypothetical protein